MNSEIAPGFCQCGCGEKTAVPDKSCASRGLIKGVPKRFAHGHNGRLQEKKPRKRIVRERSEHLCECGCGEKTFLMPWTNKSVGWIKGNPSQFITGHNARLLDHETGFPKGALVDPEFMYLEYKYTWCIRAGYVVGEHTRNGEKEEVRLHRIVTGALPGQEVDHINRIRTDNRKENLRVVTHAENCQNLPPEGHGGISGIRGVSWESQTRKWKAQAVIRDKHFSLGRFSTIEEAAHIVQAFRAANMPFSEDAQ